MVSGRSWQSVKQGLGRTKAASKKEDHVIQNEISMWIPEMSQVLENVPKEMILILKTNDLLRGLETTLGNLLFFLKNFGNFFESFWKIF